MVRRQAALGLFGYALAQAVVLTAFLRAGSPPVRAAVIVAGAVLTVAVGVVGLVVMRRDRWLTTAIAAGLALLGIGDEAARRMSAPDGSLAYPSAADVPYVVGTVVLLVTFGFIARRAVPRGDVAWLDTALASAGLVAIAVQFGIVPALAGGDPLSIVVSLTYACTDVVGIIVAARCLLTGRAVTPGLCLLAAACCAWYLSDLIYAVQVLTGDYVNGGLLDLGWYLPNALLALTCWTGFTARGVGRRGPGRHSRRMVVAALIGLLGPIGICITVWLDIPTSALSVAAGTVVPMALALLRVNRLLQLVEHQARHDPLTGLLNRAGFAELAHDELSGRAPHTAMLVDLDGFKQINDRYGHATGDAVLVTTARRLVQLAGRGGLVGRLGGDEFVVLLRSDGTGLDVAEVESSLARPVPIEAVEEAQAVQVSASAGAASARPDGPGTLSELLAAADAAMYMRKHAARAAGSDAAAPHAPSPRRESGATTRLG